MRPKKTPFSNIELLVIVVIGICAFQSVGAEEVCARDQAGLKKILKDPSFPSEWIETTADDGKPLMIKMADRHDKLYFIFDKTNEGIWAEGLIEVCSEKSGAIVKISGDDIKLGEKAPRLIRWSMSGGAKFRLQLKEKNKMSVSTLGWSGDFIPKAPVKSSNPTPVPETPAPRPNQD